MHCGLREPREHREHESPAGQWMLALIALGFLWPTLIMVGQRLHP